MKIYFPLLLFFIMPLFFSSCGSKGAYNKTMYSKNKPSRTIREEHLKHQKKVSKRMERRYKRHKLRTRD
ncbi:MAG: hypothetical protein H0X62_03960 [Bacteroidetes bacterium]|nr:hypothetical protein [Bacteroidota bacterium]